VSVPPDLVRAGILGAVQGLTEFLPISSSAHLILLPRLLDWPDQGLLADAAANTGTLLAVLVYFRRELSAVITDAHRAARRGSWRSLLVLRPAASAGREAGLFVWLALATIPVGLAGLLFGDWVATAGRDPKLIGWMSLLFGLVLAVADRRARAKGRSIESLGLRDACVFGLAQALAIVPGVSRSGITITAGLFANLDREAAARVSFLMAVPVGLLVAAKDLFDLWRAPEAGGGWLFIGVVVATAALSGWLVIALLLSWLRRRTLLGLVAYRLALSVAVLALL
jgi:undecaprenyl-diphosphatase